MTMQNGGTNDPQVEALIDQITRAVISSMAAPAGVCAVTNGGSCNSCMLCAQLAPESVRGIFDAGASRLSATVGTRVDAGVASMIDHTLLKPQATARQVVELCDEARRHQFISVCVNPGWVELCATQLMGSAVKVCAVIGFPLGATTPEVKLYEAEQCLLRGASELDMVINVGALKGGDDGLVRYDIQQVADACRRVGALSKVIIETALLTDDEKVRACQLSRDAGADYVKTSTGFGPGGATVDDIALMRRVVGPMMGVKASGGVSNLEDARNMITAGATRIGASAGVRIMREAGGGAAEKLAAGGSTSPGPKGEY